MTDRRLWIFVDATQPLKQALRLPEGLTRTGVHMRGMKTIGRLVAGPLFAVLGMAANTTASAYAVTGTNISAEVTAPTYTGDATLTFAFTRTSSESINNGKFEFSLPDAGGSIVNVTAVPAAAAICSPPLPSTSIACVISADVPTITFAVTVTPTGALLRYTWSVRPGTGTNNPPWIGEANAIVTAASGGEQVAGGSGTVEAIAATSNGNGLKGTLTAKGKGTAPIYVGVQEFESFSPLSCNGPAGSGYVVCVNFTAVNGNGTKVYYPTDLQELLRFAVYVYPNPTTFPTLVNKSIQQVTLFHADTDGSFTQIPNCPKKGTPLSICLEKRSVLNAKQAAALGSDPPLLEGTWQFILVGPSNGYVSLAD